MTVKISFVITNCGDGSNGIRWVRDPAVLEKLEELADDGDETYASGDGLQVKTLEFPDGFDLDAWVSENRLNVVDLENL